MTTCSSQSRSTAAKASSHQLLDRVGLAGGHHVVVGLVLLEHQPHGPHVVGGEAPVALGVEVPEGQLLVDARP